MPSPTPKATLPQPALPQPLEKPAAVPIGLPFTALGMPPFGRPGGMPHFADEDEGLKHFEQVGKEVHTQLGLMRLVRLAVRLRI